MPGPVRPCVTGRLVRQHGGDRILDSCRVVRVEMRVGGPLTSGNEAARED